MENVIDLIIAERERQNKKWGEQNHDNYRWLAILTEEVGELAQAILHDEFGGSHAGTAQTELVHVAAVAIQWLECMQRRHLTTLAVDWAKPGADVSVEVTIENGQITGERVIPPSH